MFQLIEKGTRGSTNTADMTPKIIVDQMPDGRGRKTFRLNRGAIKLLDIGNEGTQHLAFAIDGNRLGVTVLDSDEEKYRYTARIGKGTKYEKPASKASTYDYVVENIDWLDTADNEVELYLSPTAQAGFWQLTLEAPEDGNTTSTEVVEDEPKAEPQETETPDFGGF